MRDGDFLVMTNVKTADGPGHWMQTPPVYILGPEGGGHTYTCYQHSVLTRKKCQKKRDPELSKQGDSPNIRKKNYCIVHLLLAMGYMDILAGT